jgi:hypothetical protein
MRATPHGSNSSEDHRCFGTDERARSDPDLQYSDHNAGYGPLFLLGWTARLSTVDAYGPPPLEKMTRLLLEAYAFDIETRIADEERPPLAPLIRAHDITAAESLERFQPATQGTRTRVGRR